MGGIVKAPVAVVHFAAKHGAGLISIAADGDDRLHVLLLELVHVLAGVRADVDANLCHGFDAERVDVACGLGAGVNRNCRLATAMNGARGL